MDFGPEIDTYAGKRIGVYGGKFLPFHRGHLSYILKAQSMVDILFVVVQYDEAYERTLCDGTGFTWVPPHIRERWLAETLKPFPNIRVLSIYEHRSPAHMTDPSLPEVYRQLTAAVGGHIDIVFSNTHEYEAYHARVLPGAEHVVFYEDRPIVHISATTIREEGVYRHWETLPRPVQNHYVKRVALCGIESVGKSHLSKMLASAFNTVIAPEYGRLYYENLNGYTDIAEPGDFKDIAAGHVHMANMSVPQANRVLLTDSDLVYTQYFHLQEYGVKDPVVEAMINARADRVDEYLYIEPHNLHELDGTRLPVTDATRATNNASLRDLYLTYGINLRIIDETDRDARYQACHRAVMELLTWPTKIS